ncbi:unnamed protein product [Penicillium salamii]|uniref:GED domain-containing protein n=1 Tax=Penicillium salamii TaxID=1612424 RepID=A0A9W4J0G4_9EURO|nr:unnamed protein product [Penicillium salamii]
MDDQQVQEVAAQPSHVQVERERLNEELEKLRKARRTLNTFGAVQRLTRSIPLSGKILPYAAHRATC